MNSEIPSELDELSKTWPPQRIENYETWFNAWRVASRGNQSEGSEGHYSYIGEEWAKFANGKSLHPRLMLEWHLFLLAKRNQKGELIRHDRVQKYHHVVKKFLRWMKNCQIIQIDPSPFLPELRMQPPPPARMWTHNEYTAMVRWAEDKPKYQLPLWLFILGYHSGMSLVDCCHLLWEEVTLRDDGPCMIQRMRTKTQPRLGARAQFTVPVLVGGELWRWLKVLEKDRPAGAEYVHREAPNAYKSRDGASIRVGIAEMALGALGRQPNKTFRHLRNSFSSRLINSGADAVLVSKMTGHQNLEQLAHYVLPNIRKMQECVFNALRWVESQENPPPSSPAFLTLPSPPVEEKHGVSPNPNSLASETGGAASSAPTPKPNTV